MKSAQLFLHLARTSNLPTVWTNALAAWALSGALPDWRMVLLAVAGSLLYAGGCTLNDAFDAEWDRQHRPERPIPSGALAAKTVWLAGGAEMAAGAALLALFNIQALLSGLVLAAAILLYDWLHKKSPWSVLLMGWCRFQWVLTAAAAVCGAAIPVAVWVYAAALFVYIVGLSLVARREGRKAAPDAAGGGAGHIDPARWLPLLPVVFAAGIWPKEGGIATAAAGIFLFTVWVKVAEVLFLRRRPPQIGAYVSRLLAGIVLLDTVFAAITWGWSAFFLVAFLPACLLLQRKFAAT